ncbi:hypothetical protein SAMN05216312_11187 [Cohnella sp. OV330]|uniref:DUF6138 family protein n=1 Tax=Cohnella sp. OV330 TaxID=1855288 RepID=UPI0008DF7CAB|nr:DUF6138 family protein [Cohnella sp. OV330]SFB51737.1 hypothetical protein SAMN05216312_11187 [Cohnella sp. OV330]
MNHAIEALLHDVWEEIAAIYARERPRIDGIKNFSALQAGIKDYIRVAWRKRAERAEYGTLYIDVERPFSWSDSSYKIEAGPYMAELTGELLAEAFFPALCERVDRLFRSDELGPRFFDYRMEVAFEFEQDRDEARLKRLLVNQPKLDALRTSLERFIETKIMPDPPVLPKPSDLFFFAYHLVNPDLTAQRASAIDPLIRRLSDKLQPHPQRLREWIGQYASAFKAWAQDDFLPRHFIGSDDYGHDWRLKEASDRQAAEDDEMDFFLYAALKIGAIEPDTRQRYLVLAERLGAKQATQYLKAGSGKFASAYDGELAACSCNDISQTIEIRIRSEEEKAYGEALDYIIGLLRQGFPKGYQLKLNSVQKHFLPLPTLAKSKLHQFFANALVYPALFPKLAEYAEAAMEEFAWYGDVEPSEKSVMPGTYAVFGLGLYSEAYFPLVCRYMELVDTEHQMAQDGYAKAFIDAHGVKPEHMPAIVSILLGGNEEATPVKNMSIDSSELAEALLQALKSKKKHERELALCRIFGSADKLAKAARQAPPPLKEGLAQLSALIG